MGEMEIKANTIPQFMYCSVLVGFSLFMVKMGEIARAE